MGQQRLQGVGFTGSIEELVRTLPVVRFLKHKGAKIGPPFTCQWVYT